MKKHRNSTEAGSQSQSLQEERTKAIPGGRYGCAQFAKTCGPPELSKCSLGKLSQMVQKAINDEVIKYQKTLLVWSETLSKDQAFGYNTQEELCKKKSELTQKLEMVQRALIEILLANPEGVSLAQLPVYLKKRLPFNYSLSELGFGKLKDLVLSMNDKIKIDNKSNNHPFAVLVNPEPYHRSASSSEDFHSFSPHNPGYSQYTRQSSDMGMHKMMYHQPDFDNSHKYPSYPMTPTNYYPVYPGYQNELNRHDSTSSFHSANENRLNYNRTTDSVYVPQAASLYGNSVHQPHLNISHCRNNTGSDIGYGQTQPLTYVSNHKQGNLSHDFTLTHGCMNKIWLNPSKGGPQDDLIEINSSDFFSESSMFTPSQRSRSTSPNQHTRTVSNLNDPNYAHDPNFTMNFYR